MLVLVACLIFLIENAHGQELLMLNADDNVLMYNGESINTIFTAKYNNFDCSAYLYSYAQTQEQYAQNLPIKLQMQNVPLSQPIAISTAYGHFVPSLSQNFCGQKSCNILIYHNCPQQLTASNYFDIVQINVTGIGIFSYYVNCNQQYNPIFIQWSQVVISFCATIILLVASLFSRLKSFGNFAINYNIGCIIVVVALLLTFGLLELFLPEISNVILEVLSWICGTIAVSIVFIQIQFFLFQHSFLKQGFSIGRFKIRIMDIVGFACGLGVLFGWWYSHKNWILSDVISVCMVVSFIKIFKFVSFKIALLSYFLVLVMVTVGDVLSVLLNQLNFQIYFLFSNDNPFQFQIPVLAPTYSLKCTWISIASIFLPGLLVSYLRRFDKCRSTNIYTITTVSTYFIGSILWNIINVFSNTPIPFDAIVQPIMISSFCMFAWNRKELRTIWEGTFYDEEFVHRIEIEMIGKNLQVQTPKEDMLRDSIANNLFFNIYQDEHFQKLDGVKGELIENDQL